MSSFATHDPAHDPLCYYREDEWLAIQDCAECTMIAHVRADEREKPLNAIPRAICNSEPFLWLMVGSNHVEAQLNVLRLSWPALLAAGGGWGANPNQEEKK